MRFEITRDNLLILKQQNPEAYHMLMSVVDTEGDYCDTLDIEKLKSECANGYFEPEELFTKEQMQAYWEVSDDDVMDRMKANHNLISQVYADLPWRHKSDILSEVVQDLRGNYEPDEVFDENILGTWAENNGYVEED